MFDNSRYVRIELMAILEELLSAHKTSFTPIIMAGVIGPWWVATCDPSVEVAAAAVSAFEAAIPPKKRDSVLAFLAPSIFDFVGSILDGSFIIDNLYKVLDDCTPRPL